VTRRRSERELERALDALDEADGAATYADWWFAGVKRGKETATGETLLTPEEERLLKDPERHLSAEAWATVKGVIEYSESLRTEQEEHQ
jgi:hypothetical protein